VNQSNDDLNSNSSTQIDFTTPTPRFSVKDEDELNNGILLI